MASVTIDQITIDSRFDPSGFAQGIEASLAQFQQFTQRLSTLSAPVLVDLRLTGADKVAQEAKRVSEAITPAAFEAFSAATTQSLERVATALTELNATIAPVKQALQGFFTGVVQGAAQEAAAIEQATARQSAALKSVGGGSVFGRITTDVRLASAAFNAGQASIEDYAVAIQHAEAEMVALREAGFAPSTQQIAAFNAAAGRTGAVVVGSTRSLKSMTSSIASLTAISLGARTQVALLAENVLLLGLGGPIVAGLAVAVLAGAEAWNFYGKAQREATEATEKNAEALRKLRDQQKGPVVQAQDAFDTQREEVDRLSRALAELTIRQREAVTVPAGRSGVASLAAQNDLLRERATLLKNLAEASSLLEAASTAVADAEKQAHGAELLRALDLEVRSFGLSAIAARELAVSLDDKLTPAQKAAATATLGTLGALQAAAKARSDLLKGVDLPDTRTGLDQAVKALDAALAKPRPVAIFLDTTRVDAQLAKVLQKIQQKQRETFVASLGNIALPETTIPASFDRAAGSVGDLQDRLEEAFTAANRFGRAAVQAAHDARTAHQRLNDAIHDTTRGLDQIVGAARGIGAIGDEAANAIGSVLDLSDAIGNVIEKASAGNILGLIGAGVGLIGSVAGPNESEVQRDRVLEENNRRLTELAVALKDTQSLGALAGQRELLETIAALRGFLGAGSSGVPVDTQGRGRSALDLQRQAFLQGLVDASIDIREFAAQVKAATGIGILDEKGRLVARAFDQAKDAIDKMVEAATHFSNSLSTQQSVLEIEDKLGIGPRAGLDPEIQRLARDRQIELDRLVLDPALEARIRALDLTTKQGRAAFLEFQRWLFEQARAGRLTAEQLGGFTNVDELLGPIGDAADALDGLKSSADQLSRGFGDFNLPSGFRREFLAFQTALPVGPTLPAGPTPRIDHFSPPLPGDVTTSTRSSTVVVERGAIVINQLPGESSVVFAERVVEAIRFKANGQSGDTINPFLN